MKKSVLMLAVGGLMLATPSCKKGENDPFMSLSSRKARVAGEWNVTGWESTLLQTEADGDHTTTTETMSGNTIAWSQADHDQSAGTTTTSTKTITVNEGTYTFEKDGTWSRVWNTTTVWVDSQDIFGTTFTTTTTETETATESGDWSFVGKVKDTYKNKERMVMNTLKSDRTSQTTDVTTNDANSTVVTNTGAVWAWSQSYSSGEWEMTAEIDQLKGKEMILWWDTENSGTTSSTPNGGSTTTTTNDTWSGTTKITLTAL